MATKYESYETGDDGNAAFYDDIQRGQTFTPQVEHILGSVFIYGYKIGEPIGTVTVNVYACDAGHLPTGSILATGSFDFADIGDSAEWIGIALSGFPTLLVDNEYCIIVIYTGGDINNRGEWRVNLSSDGYTRGTRIYSLNAGVDWSTGNYDALFQEWGIIIVAPTVTTNPATSVGQTTAIKNGTLDDDGGEDCEVRFQYGETTDYGTNTKWQSGKETGDTFEQEVRALLPGRVYHFRAQAKNSEGTVNGADRTFHTEALSAKAHEALGKSHPLGRAEL